MKKRKEYKRLIVACVAVICICSLGISYANWTDGNRISENITTSILDFIFQSDNNNEFKVRLVNENSGVNNELQTGIIYSNKSLNITGIEAFAMGELLTGAASLQIDYRMVASDMQNGLLHVADGTYDLGVIPFQLSSVATVNLSNGNGVWPIDNPGATQWLVPSTIESLHGYNNIISNEKGIVTGTIVIQQSASNAANVWEITLSSLQLPEEVNQEIVANDLTASSLDIVANYYFSIPLMFEQENSMN